ncbi:MAG: triple tyrosine motif-containing protein [Bacteroidota bacterium]
MKKLCLLFVFVGFVCQYIAAQPGHYFISHSKPGNDNISYLSFDIQQDNNGILYFANRSGVLQYDGRTWAVVGVEGGVYSLAVTKAGDVYAAGSAGFGKIGMDSKNQLSYLPLSDSLQGSKNVFSAYAIGDVVYFLNDEHLFRYDAAVNKAEQIFTATPAGGLCTGLFQIGAQLYLNTEIEGLKKINGTTLEPANIPALEKTQLVFSKPSPDGKTYLIATDDNRFFLHNEGQPLTEFKPKDILYMAANVVANCTWVTSGMVAIGTLRGGIAFIDPVTGETLEISNYYAGLPDNEIFALHTDLHQGVWVAHDYGFSRVAPFLPFRTFNHYPGLAGNLLCVQSVGDKVYVGTTLGLFLLSKEDIFEDEVYNVTRTTTTKVNKEQAVEEGKEERKKFKLGLLGRRKKKGANTATTSSPSTTIVKSTKTLQKTRKILKGVEYSYKRVGGISGKVDQLLIAGDKLLCGGVGGVFEITGLNATAISREPMRTIFYSKNLKQLLVSTYNDEIKSYQPLKSNWQQTDFPDTLSTYADYIFEDNLQDLWICGRDMAVKVGIEEGEILDAETIPLPHTSIDKTVGLAYGPDVYLTQNGEFFRYASTKNSFQKYDSLPGPKKYFASAGYFWFYDGHQWRTLDPKLQGSIKTKWLGLFPDIRFMAPAEVGKSLWVITASNELYKFSSDQNQPAVTNPLFLKEVRSQQLKFSLQQKLIVDESESALTFEFIQPEYVSLQAVEYRYWVKGLQTGWSEWSTLNNIINFPFLPPGNYNVLIQSKDLFDKITELDTIDFNVVPPYWKRPWFYALEFLVFGFLVLLSRKLTESNAKYRYLSRFLSALTVIMLIQFIQTIAEYNISFKSTPVVEFFIQVFIALLVLPVEQFLRSRVVKSE